MNIIEYNSSVKQRVAGGHEGEKWSDFAFLGVDSVFQVLNTNEFHHTL